MVHAELLGDGSLWRGMKKLPTGRPWGEKVMGRTIAIWVFGVLATLIIGCFCGSIYGNIYHPYWSDGIEHG